MSKFSPTDLAGWLALAPLLMQLIDYIVRQVETLFASQAGETKRKKAKLILKTVIPGMFDGQDIPDEVFEGLIDNQVSLLNEAGLWAHKGGEKVEKDLTVIVGY